MKYTWMDAYVCVGKWINLWIDELLDAANDLINE